eukprot:12385109-Alexandrium_andersonii.AAC.1
MSQRGVLFYLKVKEQDRCQEENLDIIAPVDMGDGVLMDDSHPQAFDPDYEQFDDEAAPAANWDDDVPLVDLLPRHMRVPPPKPSQREIDLHEITHTPYAE